MSFILTFLSSLLKSYKITAQDNRNRQIKEAHEICLQGRVQEALDILENLNMTDNENSVAAITGFLLKAICYAELGYTSSAQNSINVVLGKSRMSINPLYQYTLNDCKDMAKQIVREYNL